VDILDLPITLGFLGLMALCLRAFLSAFPEIARLPQAEDS
jgi:hypothetical protein